MPCFQRVRGNFLPIDIGVDHCVEIRSQVKAFDKSVTREVFGDILEECSGFFSREPLGVDVCRHPVK